MKVYVLTMEGMFGSSVVGVTMSVGKAKEWLASDPEADVIPVIPDCGGDFFSVKGIIGWNHRFPDRPRAQDPDFFGVAA